MATSRTMRINNIIVYEYKEIRGGLIIYDKKINENTSYSQEE